MLKMFTALAILATSANAMAQDDITLNSLAKKEPAAFNQMLKGHHLPGWVSSGGTTTPARTVKAWRGCLSGAQRLQTSRLRCGEARGAVVGKIQTNVRSFFHR